MEVGLIILGLLVVGCIIRYSVEAGSKKESAANAAPVKHISEWTLEDFQAELQKLDVEIEMSKIRYQGALSNPQVWPVTRDMIKNNLESAIQRKATLTVEMNKRYGTNC